MTRVRAITRTQNKLRTSILAELNFSSFNDERYQTKQKQQVWTDLFQRRAFFAWLGQALGYVSFSCWYRVNYSDIKRLGGSGLLSLYFNGSVHSALKEIYPEYPWEPWKFNSVTQNFWKNMKRRRIFFDWLGREQGYASMESWYKISGSEIINQGGSGLLSHYYNGSVYNALSEIYPEYPWIPWRFNLVPNNFWLDSYHRRSYFDWLRQELDILSFENWYRVNYSDIAQCFGSGLVTYYYNGSIFNALKDIYSEHPWVPWKFNYVSRNFWSDSLNHRAFLEYLGKELGFLDFPDYYRLSLNDIIAHGGSGFAQSYNKSTYRCLKTIFPEFDWSAKNFSKSPRRSIAPRIFDDSIFSSIKVRNPEDWYRVPLSKVKKFGIQTKKELLWILKQKYPEFQWNFEKFRNTKRKIVQWELLRLIEEILEKKSPQISVLEDYWGLYGFTNLSGARSMELDIFVPSVNLAFEYQGHQHFRNHLFFGRNVDYKLKDDLKRLKCKRVGITLIEVPYDMWLDEVSVLDLVRRTRPDLIE